MKPMANTIGVLETIVIETVEDMVEDYCNRKFELQEHEDEQCLIRRPSVTFDQIIIAQRVEYRLKHRPVTEFIELKQVRQRSATDGEPVSPVTIARNLYSVDFQAGILVFGAPLLGFDIGTFPLGLTGGSVSQPYIELLATYEAGYEEIPARLKLAVLMVIARVYRMTSGSDWHRTQTQTTGVQAVWQEFIREKGGFTPEERAILDKFATPAAA